MGVLGTADTPVWAQCPSPPVSWLLVERQRLPGAVGCGNASRGQSFATLDCTHLGLRTSLCPPGGNPPKISHPPCLNPAITHPVALWRGRTRGRLSVCPSVCRRWGLQALSRGVDAAQEQVFLGRQQEQLLEGEPGELQPSERPAAGARGPGRAGNGADAGGDVGRGSGLHPRGWRRLEEPRNLGSAPIGCKDGCPNLWASVGDASGDPGFGGGACFGDGKRRHRSHQPASLCRTS